MLILSRKRGETVVIGEHITLMVVDIHGGKVRLGIDAPKDVPISRGELLTRGASNHGKENGKD